MLLLVNVTWNRVWMIGWLMRKPESVCLSLREEQIVKKLSPIFAQYSNFIFKAWWS